MKATPHNSARGFDKRFCSKIKFGKHRNTVCISSFSNCKIGAKDPAKAADAIVRCCLKSRFASGVFRPSYLSAHLPQHHVKQRPVLLVGLGMELDAEHPAIIFNGLNRAVVRAPADRNGVCRMRDAVIVHGRAV